MERAKRVSVLPTGIADCRDLPGHNYWLSRLFVNFEDRMKEDGKFGFLKINQHRLTNDKNGSDSSKDIEDQDVVFDSTFKKNVGIAAASSSVGVAGTAVGASIGATIGALAIGIPSFGVFAGGGLVLGGAIGGAAGVSTVAASAILMQWYASKRKIKKIKQSMAVS